MLQPLVALAALQAAFRTAQILEMLFVGLHAMHFENLLYAILVLDEGVLANSIRLVNQVDVSTRSLVLSSQSHVLEVAVEIV